MKDKQDFQHIFSKQAMEFATVAREYCVFAENALKYSKADYLKVASRLLPLLYIKASLLPEVALLLDDGLEEIVDYDTYETVRLGIHDRLTSHDDYLEVFKDDFQFSETPIAASISEDMADIYQDVRNFCEQYQSGMDEIMNDALSVVSEKFRTYWGQKLSNALGAIHNALYGGGDLSDEAPAPRTDEDSLEAQGESQDDGMDVADRSTDMAYFLRGNGMRLVGGKGSNRTEGGRK